MTTSTINILVADDEADLALLMRKKFRRRIRKKELAFEFVLNGKEALNALQNNGGFDLLFTDINMPVMDGLTLLKKVRELEHPVKPVVISAYGDMENIRTAMNLGAFDFVTKPINLDDLEITLDKTVGEINLLRQGAEAQEQLEEAKAKRYKAEASQKFKEQFLANMSHEIRTPMNAVMGITNLLLQKNPRPDQIRYLNIIKQSADNLLVILNDILDISKIEAGKMVFEKKPFSIQKEMEGVVNIMRLKAAEKGLQFFLKIEENTPPTLVGDPARLSQILINLVGNAIKFTEKGSVTIDVGQAGKKEDDMLIRFAVTDTGIGIAKEKLTSIFESFTQADSTINRKFGGTGLGLTISRQLISLQGGELMVESEVGEGAEFSFVLPFQVADNQAVELSSKNDKVSGSQLKKLKILLAEDNEFNAVVAIDTLKMELEEVEVSLAETGKVAIDKLQENDYDLILMDIHMPEMNGYEAATFIRNQLPEPLRNIPIIAMTASATQAEIQQCFDCGMNEYISKPFDPSVLVQKIASLLKIKAVDGEQQADTNTQTPVHTNTLHTDLSFLEKFTNGDPNKLIKYINIFLKTAPSQLSSLATFLQNKDWKGVCTAAHTLKSQLNYMGAYKLKALALTIESNAKEATELDNMPDWVGQLIEQTKEAIEELEAKVAELG